MFLQFQARSPNIKIVCLGRGQSRNNSANSQVFCEAFATKSFALFSQFSARNEDVLELRSLGIRSLFYFAFDQKLQTSADLSLGRPEVLPATLD